MSKPLLYDVYCGGGGASAGYVRAGFRVVGIDNRPQPRYLLSGADAFIQMDAFEFFRRVQDGEFEQPSAWHCSPPCQAFTTARVIHGRDHDDLLTPTRELLQGFDCPWVIENVPGAPMRPDVILCGSHFGLRSDNGGLIRHRWFEFWQPTLLLVPLCNHDATTISVFGHGGHIYHGVEDWRRVMGIDWLTRDELAQAIPPVYTNLIGRQLMTAMSLIEQAS